MLSAYKIKKGINGYHLQSTNNWKQFLKLSFAFCLITSGSTKGVNTTRHIESTAPSISQFFFINLYYYHKNKLTCDHRSTFCIFVFVAIEIYRHKWKDRKYHLVFAISFCSFCHIDMKSLQNGTHKEKKSAGVTSLPFPLNWKYFVTSINLKMVVMH